MNKIKNMNKQFNKISFNGFLVTFYSTMGIKNKIYDSYLNGNYYQKFRMFSNSTHEVINSESTSTSTENKLSKKVETENLNKIMGDLFDEIKYTLDNNDISWEIKQREMEKFIYEQGKEYLKDKPSKEIFNVNIDKLSKDLKLSIYDFEINFKEYWKKKLKTLKIEDPIIYKIISTFNEHNKYRDVYSIVVLNFLLVATKEDDLENKITNADFNIKLGREILDRYKIILKEKYCKENNIDRISFEDWYKKVDKKTIFPFEEDSKFYVRLGAKFWDDLSLCEMLEIYLEKTEYDKHVSYIKVHSKIKDKIPKDNKVLVLPLKLPMVVEPMKYSKYRLGGYLEKFNDRSNLIIQKRNFQKNSSINQNNIIYETINSINSTPFTINNKVFNFIYEYGVKFGIILDKNEKHKYEIIQEKKKLYKYQLNILKSHKSKIFQEHMIMLIAYIYENCPNIYFPVRIDQRGRLYCEPNYLNYQGSDVAKSLISFALPGFIKRDDEKTIKTFLSYGGNLFGLDKKSIKTRVNWVKNNSEKILNFDKDLENSILYKAENKPLFLAFCYEYRRWIEYYHSDDNEPFKTYLPIQLDATCNGFQHLALLSYESKIFKELNLVNDSNNNSDEAIPRDLYNYMLISVNNEISEALKNNNHNYDIKSIERLSKFFLERKDIKKLLMTYPYNAATLTLMKYLELGLSPVDENLLNDEEIEYLNTSKEERNSYNHWFSAKGDSRPYINSDDIATFVRIIKLVIKRELVLIHTLTKYLKDVARICSKLKVPILWNLPHGLVVEQSYLKQKDFKLKPFGSRNTSISLLVNTNEFDNRKNTTALMPNLIHSLDSTSLIMCKYMLDKEVNCKSFYSIHDCFAVTADNVEALMSIIRSVYTSLYIEETYIFSFDKGVINNILHVYGSTIEFNENTRTFHNKKTGEKYKILDIKKIFEKEKKKANIKINGLFILN